MKRTIVLASACALAPILASAQAPIGSEFQVNTYTTLAQYYPGVAADAAGDFVVVWASQGQDGNNRGVFGQRFDAQGRRLGAEFQVNTYTTSAQQHVSVASDPAGNFVVTWAGYYQDGSGFGIFAQRYDATGAQRGSEFRVNTYTSGSQVSPHVAVDAAGDFVIAWRGSNNQDGDGYGIFGRRYDASGTALGGEFRVNSYTTYFQISPSVSSDPAGNFVVAWTSHDGSLDGVFAQRFDASGARRGGEFRVNTYTTGRQQSPSVAGDAAGNFVIAWESRYQDGSQYGVFAQRYDPSGVALGTEFRVNTYTTGWQWNPAVAADAATGKFTIVWTNGFGTPVQVQAQRYDASGAPQGPEIRVSTSSNVHTFARPDLALWRGGSSVVVWTKYPDGDYYGVFGQCYGGLLPAALAVDPSASNGSDGNGIFEPGESAVAVEPSWTNVADTPLTLTGEATSFGGPPGGGVVYELTDAAAAYGTLGSGSTARCVDCYAVGVSFGGTRPSLHWDARLVERADAVVTDSTQEWMLHVGATFSDVPRSGLFYRDIETLIHKGITGGCTAGQYCPGDPVTREQMAVFTLEAREGAGYRPPPCALAPLFEDVPPSSFFCPWIEELAGRGVVSGCGGGNYCPGAAVTREQMPVFVLRLLDPTLDPPACTTPRFADVPASSPFCRWIEELARRGVVAGCGGGNYCPTAPVTRDQMAAFLTGTYGLSLYGP